MYVLRSERIIVSSRPKTIGFRTLNGQSTVKHLILIRD